MNLVAYTATALSRNDIADTPTNKNIVDGAIVELKDLDGNLVVIYDDESGSNPETQKSCNTNGQLTFWAEVGDYILIINGEVNFITIGASVKFTKQSRQAIEAIYKAQGYNNVFFFEDGFTYTESNDVGIYEDGTAWTYADTGALPVDIDAGAVPSEGVYRELLINSPLSVIARTYNIPITNIALTSYTEVLGVTHLFDSSTGLIYISSAPLSGLVDSFTAIDKNQAEITIDTVIHEIISPQWVSWRNAGDLRGWGAYEDGVNDDVAAIESAALASGGVVKLKAGKEYAIGSGEFSNLLLSGGGTIKNLASDINIRVSGRFEAEGVNFELSDVSTSCVIYCSNILPKFKGVIISGNLSTVFSYASTSETADSFGMTGEFVADSVVVTEGSMINHVFKNLGTSNWDKLSSHDCNALVNKCTLRATDFNYSFKGFNNVKETDCKIIDAFHHAYARDWLSQDFGLSTFWSQVSSSASIYGNSFTTTAGNSGIFLSDLVVGETYRIAIDFQSDAQLTIFNGLSSGTVIAAGLTTGAYSFEFLADDARIFLRANIASTTTILECRAIRESTTRMAVTLDTMSNSIRGSSYYGGSRGPTSGIDTQSTTIIGNEVYDAWEKAFNVDTERFSPPDWSVTYPLSKAKVSDNKAYFCGRGFYGTGKDISIMDNTFDFCGMFVEGTLRPAVVRINTTDEQMSNDNAQMFVSGNTSTRASGVSFCSVRGGVVTEFDNDHDSMVDNPLVTDGSPARYSKKKSLTVKERTESFKVSPSSTFEVVNHSDTGTFLEIDIPTSSTVSMFRSDIMFSFVGGGSVRFKAQTGLGTVNGGQLTVVPNGTKTARLLVYSENNDCYLTFD